MMELIIGNYYRLIEAETYGSSLKNGDLVLLNRVDDFNAQAEVAGVIFNKEENAFIPLMQVVSVKDLKPRKIL